MTTLMRGGNIGVTSTWPHPDGHCYVLLKRDIPGSAVLLYEQNWQGIPTRLIKLWASRSDMAKIVSAVKAEERAAGRPDSFATREVEKPIASPSVAGRPDGSLILNHVFGGGDGLTDWSVEIIEGACAPWSPQGTWPLTVSATDEVARRAAATAHSRADVAARMADAAGGKADKANEAAKKAASSGGLSRDDVLGVVSDDIALGLKKDGQGRRQGRLIHALWQVVGSVLDDLLWAREQAKKG